MSCAIICKVGPSANDRLSLLFFPYPLSPPLFLSVSYFIVLQGLLHLYLFNDHSYPVWLLFSHVLVWPEVGFLQPLGQNQLKLVFVNSFISGCTKSWASQVALVVKNLPSNVGDVRDVGSISGSGRSPGGGLDNPLWYFCLENSMNRRTWWLQSMGSQRVGRD